MNLAGEIQFQTTRSGGKGGQNVNKVETAVIGSLDIRSSMTLSDDQKEILLVKLSNRINSEGILQVRSQAHRTQLANKEEVVKKLNDLVKQALKKKKLRVPTKASKASKQKRLESKKRNSDRKADRRYRPE